MDISTSILKIILISIPVMNAISTLCFRTKRLIFLIFLLLNLSIIFLQKHVKILYRYLKSIEYFYLYNIQLLFMTYTVDVRI